MTKHKPQFISPSLLEELFYRIKKHPEVIKTFDFKTCKDLLFVARLKINPEIQRAMGLKITNLKDTKVLVLPRPSLVKYDESFWNHDGMRFEVLDLWKKTLKDLDSCLKEARVKRWDKFPPNIRKALEGMNTLFENVYKEVIWANYIDELKIFVKEVLRYRKVDISKAKLSGKILLERILNCRKLDERKKLRRLDPDALC